MRAAVRAPSPRAAPDGGEDVGHVAKYLEHLDMVWTFESYFEARIWVHVTFKNVPDLGHIFDLFATVPTRFPVRESATRAHASAYCFCSPAQCLPADWQVTR